MSDSKVVLKGDKVTYPHKNMDALKEALKKNATGGIVCMRILMEEAAKEDGTISAYKMVHIVGTACPSFTLGDMLVLVKYFSKDRRVDYAAFLKKLRPFVPAGRKALLNKLYDGLDANGNGAIEMDDLKLLRQKSGNKFPEKYYQETKDLKTLLTRMRGGQVMPATGPQINRENFFDYYSYVSARVKEDKHFETTINKHWKLPTE